MHTARSAAEARAWLDLQGRVVRRHVDEVDAVAFHCVRIADGVEETVRFAPFTWSGWGFGPPDTRSELISAGQWRIMADHLAVRTPADGAALVLPLLQECLTDVAVAVAALDEAAALGSPDVALRAELIGRATRYESARPFAAPAPRRLRPGPPLPFPLVQALHRAHPPGSAVDHLDLPGTSELLVTVTDAAEQLRFVVVHEGDVWALVLQFVAPDGTLRGHRVLDGPSAVLQHDVLREAAPLLAGGPPPTPASLAKLDADLRTIAAHTAPLLRHLAADPSALDEVRPEWADVLEAFTGPMTETLGRRMVARWRQPLSAVPGEGQTELSMALCTGGGFQSYNVLSAAFPLPWLGLAPHLAPHRTWLRWSWHRPGHPEDRTTYDGLVWTGKRWVWFPSLWEHLG